MRTKHDKGEIKSKSWLFGIVTILVLVLLIAILVLRTSGPFAGQAYRPGAPTDVGEQAVKSVYFEHATGFAAPGDKITIPLYVKAAFEGGEQNIQAIQYCFKYDFDKFDVNNLVITLSGYSMLTPSSNVAGYLGNAHDGSDPNEPCPSGYTAHIDVAVAPSSPVIGTDGAKLGDLKLEVVATAAGLSSIGNPEKIEVRTTIVTGSMTAGGSYEDKIGKDSSTDIFLVPACPSVDKDDFPPSMTLNAFKDGINSEGVAEGSGDYRACPSYNALTDQIAFDCDDNDNTVFPGGAEGCDGKDNNCDGTTDEGNYGANTEQKGVCAGNKVCLGSLGSGAVNTYDVPDSLQETVRTTQPYRDATNFFQGDKEKFSFEEVESEPETKCDGLDNDCDGSIDEGLTGCDFGEKSIVGFPPGNIYVDYGTDNILLPNQLLTTDDIFLVEQMKEVLDSELGCGDPSTDPAQAPCFREVGGVPTWICRNGVFYQYYASQPQGQQTLKFSPTSKKLTFETVIPDGENVLQGITC